VRRGVQPGGEHPAAAVEGRACDLSAMSLPADRIVPAQAGKPPQRLTTGDVPSP